MFELIHDLVGRGAETITWWQMSIRAVVIFFYLLLLVRVGGKRVFGKNTSFDIVLGVMLGSVLSRCLTGNAKFFPTLVASAVLVFLHAFLANLSFRSSKVGHTVKGKEALLVRDGTPIWETMRRTNVTEHDILEALRISSGQVDLAQVKEAYLERNGSISFVQE